MWSALLITWFCLVEVNNSFREEDFGPTTRRVSHAGAVTLGEIESPPMHSQPSLAIYNIPLPSNHVYRLVCDQDILPERPQPWGKAL